MTDDPKGVAPSSLVLYAADDGSTRIACRFEDGSVWLTQAQLAELFQVTVPTVNEHLRNIFAEGEVVREATVRKFLMVRTDGNRSVSRSVDHLSLPVILAVGYRVRSPRGVAFRQWATARLEEYLRKGCVMDDERLRDPSGPGNRRSVSRSEGREEGGGVETWSRDARFGGPRYRGLKPTAPALKPAEAGFQRFTSTCRDGAAPDHVHLLLRWDEVLALSTVVGRIKGATSHAWNRSFTDVPLVWQDGFWAESCAAEPPAELTAYVRGQRAHHGSNALDGAWELGTAG